MTLTFGTDGVRGDAEVLLTDERVVALGRAAARVLGGPAFVLGRDTRESGARIVDAFATGLAAEGVGVRSAGVAPTPAVAWLAAGTGLPAAMVSASHNPWQDNGIKLFSAGGRKLPDEVEARLEAAYAEVVDAAPPGVVPAPTPTSTPRSQPPNCASRPRRPSTWCRSPRCGQWWQGSAAPP